MTDKKDILVIGATGQQGKSIIRHLSKNNKFNLRALTRDTKSEKAAEISKLGVTLFAGDVLNRENLKEAMKNVYGVVSILQLDHIKEVEAGKLINEVAKECNVQHFIYSTVGGAHEKTGVPHFDSKHEVEKHLMNIGLNRYTILRPVWFMENFINLPHVKQSIDKGVLCLSLAPNQKLQMIAVDDIGGFVALAFEKPDQFSNKALEIAGDEITMQECAKMLGCTYEVFPKEKLDKDMRLMFEFFEKKGYTADIAALKKIYPQLTDFKTFVHKAGLAKNR